MGCPRGWGGGREKEVFVVWDTLSLSVSTLFCCWLPDYDNVGAPSLAKRRTETNTSLRTHPQTPQFKVPVEAPILAQRSAPNDPSLLKPFSPTHSVTPLLYSFILEDWQQMDEEREQEVEMQLDEWRQMDVEMGL
ncbi:hypothetical protein JB92DRAFT_2845146 [Gautieria morchelliformis]|nr:hypothetical protein JB92DRAFT_2845146 [Gautieria morchelliformis]